MQLNSDINPESFKIGVVGAGSWGTAIADLLGGKGFSIDLWAYEQEVVHQIRNDRENKIFLPGFTLSDSITASNDLHAAVANKNLVVIVVPSHVMRETSQTIPDCGDGSFGGFENRQFGAAYICNDILQSLY